MSKEMWNSGYSVSEPSVLVERSVYNTIRGAKAKALDKEYSILFKGKWEERGFMVYNEYYIPKQSVSSASVDYKEDIGLLREKEGYNVVVHSHPFCKGNNGRFSMADKESINTHFPVSLLVNGHGNIICADMILNTPCKSHDILIELDIDSIYTFDRESVAVKGLDNIETERVLVTNHGITKTPHIPKTLESYSDYDGIGLDDLDECDQYRLLQKGWL